MPCRDVKTAVSSAGHVKKSVYLHSTGQGLGGAQCPMQVPTAAETGGQPKEKLGDYAGRAERGWFAQSRAESFKEGEQT